MSNKGIPRGAFLGVPASSIKVGRMREAKPAIGLRSCPTNGCGRTLVVFINAKEWPYYGCSHHEGCGAKFENTGPLSCRDTFEAIDAFVMPGKKNWMFPETRTACFEELEKLENYDPPKRADAASAFAKEPIELGEKFVENAERQIAAKQQREADADTEPAPDSFTEPQAPEPPIDDDDGEEDYLDHDGVFVE